MSTLLELSVGQTASIKDYSGSMHEAYRMRLNQLGFREGRKVQCVQRPNLGAPSLYRVGTAVYSLDADTAQQITIQY